MRMSKSIQGTIGEKATNDPIELKRRLAAQKAEAKKMNSAIRSMSDGQMRTAPAAIPEGDAKMNQLIRQHARSGSNSQPLADVEPGQKLPQAAGNAGAGTGTRMPAAKLPLTFNEALKEVLELRKRLGDGDIDLSIKGR